MSEEKVMELSEERIIEAEVVETEGKVSKVKNFIKKHGKKAAAVVAVGTVGLIGYALGHKSNGNTHSIDDVIDGDYFETDDVKNDEE